MKTSRKPLKSFLRTVLLFFSPFCPFPSPISLSSPVILYICPSVGSKGTSAYTSECSWITAPRFIPSKIQGKVRLLLLTYDANICPSTTSGHWRRLTTWWKGQLHVPRPSSVEELSTAWPTQSNLPRDLLICVCIATAEFVLLLDTDILSTNGPGWMTHQSAKSSINVTQYEHATSVHHRSLLLTLGAPSQQSCIMWAGQIYGKLKRLEMLAEGRIWGWPNGYLPKCPCSSGQRL